MMWLMYLIGRLSCLQGLCCCTALVLGIILVFCGFIRIGELISPELTDEALALYDKWLKRGIITFAISIAGCIFIPCQTEMYAIIGIGGTVEYLKGNEKARQLPDKVIDAVYHYLDTVKEDEKK